MPVEHMVWLKFKPQTSPEMAMALVRELAELGDHVPGIERIRIGENFTDRASGYTHGAIVTLTDRDALPVYANHPVHMAFAQRLTAVADLLVMDVEVD